MADDQAPLEAAHQGEDPPTPGLDETSPSTPPQQAEDSTAASTSEPKRNLWFRRALLAVLIFGLAAVLILPKIPRDQRVRLHFGTGSSALTEVRMKLLRENVIERESSLRFPRGAPPSVFWEFELPDGEATLELELHSAALVVPSKRSVSLHHGQATEVELATELRQITGVVSEGTR